MLDFVILCCGIALVVIVIAKGWVCFWTIVRALFVMTPICALIGCFIGVCCNVVLSIFSSVSWNSPALPIIGIIIGACIGIYATYNELRDAWYA